MAKKIKTKNCVCCGTKYEYCSSCSSFIKEPAWKNIFHNENCKNIFFIATDYALNSIDKEYAKEMLRQCDLANLECMRESVVKTINDILDCSEENE